MYVSQAILLAAVAIENVAADSSVVQKTRWPGWNGIQTIFSFGDSYTATGFNVNSTQPSAANPFGNPPYPGWTSANGPVWIDFLTTTYNKSLLYTYNLAFGGATVDSNIVKPYATTVLSLKDQVSTEYSPVYAGHPSTAPWASNTTLFSFFFGINDVGNSWWLSNVSSINQLIFAEYRRNVDVIYSSGGRNFLFLLVPPIDRAPLLANSSSDPASQAWTTENSKKAFDSFNTGISQLASDFAKSNNDSTVLVFDTHKVFGDILDNSTVYPQTANLRNTTTFCAAYQSGTSSPTTYDASCGVPVNQYFWLNNLHPTYPVHNATAWQLASFLESV